MRPRHVKANNLKSKNQKNQKKSKSALQPVGPQLR